jgi:hypothetical protein
VNRHGFDVQFALFVAQVPTNLGAALEGGRVGTPFSAELRAVSLAVAPALFAAALAVAAVVFSFALS